MRIKYPQGFEKARLRLDAGDLIYSLLFCQILGTKEIFFGTNDSVSPYVNEDGIRGVPGKCSQKIIDFISPLILFQTPHFSKIEKYDSQEYSFDYGEFHAYNPPVMGTNLTEWHANKFGINWMELSFPWLSAGKNDSLFGKVAINKTTRYTIRNHPVYKQVLDANKGDCIFVGSSQDHLSFEEEYAIKIDYLQTDNSLEMANAINSCRFFLGNSSFCAAVAIGLGKRSFIELNTINNYLFFNSYTSFL